MIDHSRVNFMRPGQRKIHAFLSVSVLAECLSSLIMGLRSDAPSTEAMPRFMLEWRVSGSSTGLL